VSSSRPTPATTSLANSTNLWPARPCCNPHAAAIQPPRRLPQLSAKQQLAPDHHPRRTPAHSRGRAARLPAGPHARALPTSALARAQRRSPRACLLRLATSQPPAPARSTQATISRTAQLAHTTHRRAPGRPRPQLAAPRLRPATTRFPARPSNKRRLFSGATRPATVPLPPASRKAATTLVHSTRTSPS
jgi:hypothetical protein